MKNFISILPVAGMILITMILSQPVTTISQWTYKDSNILSTKSQYDSPQTKFPEHYFRFPVKLGVDLNILTRIISLDNVKNGFAYAYANE